ncbi:MAG: ABC-type dipeptide/oligopeptide/nickel transportsystem, permease component [Acidimicrobiaceae bacterium]|nr:ABC-type dipeptide/oligopeptide/nickel transportsystem, permease component [Acidimicrobiaceae bacterium]
MTMTAPQIAAQGTGLKARPSRFLILFQPHNLVWTIGGVIIIAAGILGIVLQLVPSWRHLYLTQDLTATFQAPLSTGHVLGTDNLGRDLLWQLIAGLGISLMIGIGVTVLSLVLGLTVGILGAYFGRTADAVSNVIVDVTWAFPAILLAVLLAGAIGPSVTTVVLALALTTWPGYARIVRGEVLSLRERDFVNAARVLGVPKLVISVRHFVVNLMPITIVIAVYYVATAIIGEAGLSFLGLGVQAPMPSLGLMLSVGQQYLNVSWWPVVLSGALLALVVLFLNAFGDFLRGRLDPHGRVPRR